MEDKLCISFKKSELWILKELKKHSSPGAVIKDILKDYFADKNPNKE